LRVLYDITTLGKIHCAEGVQGAGIFRATESMGVALARTAGVELFLSSSPKQYDETIRYLTETEPFDIGRFAVPSFGANDFTGLRRRSSEIDHASDAAGSLGEEHLAGVYTPERIYNPAKFDIYHVNWRGEGTLPANAYPTVVLSVFDVIALKNPEWFVPSGETNQVGEYLSALLTSVGAQHVIVVNAESVKEDLLSLFPNISRDQVHVVPLGVSDAFRPCSDNDSAEAVRTTYGIPAGQRYILCLNTLEPRKNMIAAVEAYSELARNGGVEDVSLVLAGSKGWLFDDLIRRCDALAEFEQASVVITGYVQDADIPTLYSGASLFCYPSLDEGFGLPVLEAMKCGVPVVTSDIAPLREVGGDAVLYVDPNDPTALAETMHTLLNDDSLVKDLQRRGVERASSYSWDRSAAEMASVYDQASRGRTASSASRLNRPVARVFTGTSGGTRSKTIPHAGSLAELKNRFRGERVFVLGDTVALDCAPLDLLADEFTLATNSFYERYETLSWKPSFYAVAHEALSPGMAGEVNALTGSLFFFDEEERHQLRTGPDVLFFKTDRDSVEVDGTSLFEAGTPPTLHGPDRGMAVAIQIAHHLGFDPIYLAAPAADWSWGNHESAVAPIIDEGAVGADARVRDRPRARRIHVRKWHLACRDAFDATGRRIANISPDMLLDTYKREDTYDIFASSKLPEFDRTQHASLDETEVISDMLGHSVGPVRTMIDVGAHTGTSAAHFVRKGWKIHCYEPDPNNRKHLTKKFGDLDEVTIDVRAVGEEPATQVPFFTSAESTGISGLSAFRESHELLGHVDMTTVAEIVDEHEITHIDFLKIDVEGFDLGVLKGVPWDRIKPAVIECEFEDAKTLPMGHSSTDIAEYLRARGYFVYFSEWHPIIRYGIPHDWRRVVPYPGVDVPSNSWGNLLAFETDPGYGAVQMAFAAVVKTAEQDEGPKTLSLRSEDTMNSRAPREGSGPPKKKSGASGGSKQTRASAGRRTERAVYADFGDRLRRRSPTLYSLLRLTRRVLARMWRRKTLLIAALVALAGVIAAGLAASSDELRYVIWGGSAFVGLGLAILIVASYAYAGAQRRAEAERRLRGVEKRARSQSKRADRRLTRLGLRLDNVDVSVTEIKRELRRLDRIESDLSRSVSQTVAREERVELVNASVAEFQGTVEAFKATMGALQREVVASGSEGKAVKQTVADLKSAVETQQVFSNYSNAAGLRMQERWLRHADVEQIRTEWLRRFGLSMSDRELRYLAHKICLDEERCEGRLATTIQAAMLRALSLLSLKSDTIELLEIGSLCGVSAGTLYRTGLRAGRNVNLTLIDPLTGYYDDRLVDGQTGVAITRKTLTDNLAALGVDESHYRIIQGLSTDPDALEMASDRQYDFVLIDGDHSLQGVSNDFELYGDAVKPGGLLIFDDYETEDWPAIKPYVDERVRPLDEWLWVGGGWRTGILQKKLTRAHLES